jgi:Tfp pilus assembly protein PilF
MKTGIRLVMVVVLVLWAASGAFAQMPPMDDPQDPDGMEMNGPRPGMREMGPPMGQRGGHPGMMRGGMKGPMDPEMKARREKRGALQTMAEAYKNLSELYIQQGKLDEAVAQLRKIIDLSSSDTSDDPGIGKYLGRVYMEMAEIYMKGNRISDAEAVLNEGIEKSKAGDIDLSSRLALQLGKIQQKAGKADEAEKSFKRVIELNSSRIK